jgi:molybdenum cofactor biosynthesis enzyme MoaA
MRKEPKKKSLDVICFTNGILITSEVAFKLFDQGLDTLLISVDSMIPEKYRLIRQGATLKEALAGVRHAVKANNQVGSGSIKITKIVFPNETEADLLAFLERCEEFGLNSIEFHIENRSNGCVEDYMNEILRLSSMQSLNDHLKTVSLPKMQNRRILCSDLWRSIHFDIDGFQRFCCMDFRETQGGERVGYLQDCKSCVFPLVGGC